MTDYLTFWRAERPVFLSPVTGKDLFVAPALAPALARLLVFCQQTQALMVVAGEAGTGKTTLLNWLFDTLDPETYEVLLMSMVRKERDGGWLTPRIAELMGLDPLSGDLLRATAARLDELTQEKRKLIVAVDATHLAETPDALGEIVAYLNLSSLAGSCLSFVLCGETPLTAVVAATAPLAARAAFNLTLPRLGVSDTEAYLAHRTRLAGFPSPFEPGAVDLIHARSRGVLSSINGYAENCLVEAAVKGSRKVTMELARDAAQHLGHAGGSPISRPLRAPPAAAPLPGASGAAGPAPVHGPATTNRTAAGGETGQQDRGQSAATNRTVTSVDSHEASSPHFWETTTRTVISAMPESTGSEAEPPRAPAKSTATTVTTMTTAGLPLKNPFSTHIPGLDAEPAPAPANHASEAKASGDGTGAPEPAPKGAAIKLTSLFKAEPRRQKS